VDKFTRLVDDFGPFGGGGMLAMLAAWALTLGDLTNFEFVRLKAMPSVQVLATVLALLGLMSMAFELKRAKQSEDRVEKSLEQDTDRWMSLISYVKDRRALFTIMSYERLPYLGRSIREIRSYIQDQISALDKHSRLRDLLESLQTACREFEDTTTRMELSIRHSIAAGDEAYRSAYPRLAADPSLQLMEGVNWIGELYPAINQLQLVTSVGILRGKVISALDQYGARHDPSARWTTLKRRFSDDMG
jgi:hypothetical protein